jgi:hypothetical protein
MQPVVTFGFEALFLLVMLLTPCSAIWIKSKLLSPVYKIGGITERALK